MTVQKTNYSNINESLIWVRNIWYMQKMYICKYQKASSQSSEDSCKDLTSKSKPEIKVMFNLSMRNTIYRLETLTGYLKH